jgi:cytochrome c nitrite reductase small subunit
MRPDTRTTQQPHRATIRGFALALLIGAFLGASGWTFHTGKGTSYFSDDPATCVNCHIMREQFAGWQKSSHHAFATCNSCHVPHDFVGKWYTKSENGIRHSWAFTFGGFPEPIQARPVSSAIVEHNCRECHRELVGELLSQRSTGTESHPSADCADNCLHCHSHVGHGATW